MRLLSSSLMSFSLYVLGPSLSATPPPLRYARVRAPQGRGVCEASRGKSSSKRDAWGPPLTCKQPMRHRREKRGSRGKNQREEIQQVFGLSLARRFCLGEGVGPLMRCFRLGEGVGSLMRCFRLERVSVPWRLLWTCFPAF